MKKSFRRIRDTVTMGITWAVQWAILAVLIGTITELLFSYSIEKNHLDPLMALAMPGFIAGVIFSIVLWFVESGRRLDELSLPRLAACGAVVGLLLGVLALTLGTPREPLWRTVVMIVCSSTLLSTVSAIGSALLFRYFARHKIPVHAETEH